jgi:hypothetical protein
MATDRGEGGAALREWFIDEARLLPPPVTSRIAQHIDVGWNSQLAALDALSSLPVRFV